MTRSGSRVRVGPIRRRGSMSGTRVATVLLSAMLAWALYAAPAPATPKKEAAAAGALHSLRAPVTDETFYFVMADRFNNGDASNDTGGIQPVDPSLPDRDEHGFDPTSKAYYNGG